MKTYKVSQATKDMLDKLELRNFEGDVRSFNSLMDTLIFSGLEEFRKARQELLTISNDLWFIHTAWNNRAMYAVNEFIRGEYKVEVKKPKYHVILIDNGENCSGCIWRYSALAHASEGNTLKTQADDYLKNLEQWDYEDIPDKYKRFAVEVEE